MPGGLEVEHLDERLDGARLADAQLHALVLMRAPEGIGMSPSGSEGIRGDPRGSEGIRGDQKGIRGDQKGIRGDQRGSEGIRRGSDGDQTGLRRNQRGSAHRSASVEAAVSGGPRVPPS